MRTAAGALVCAIWIAALGCTARGPGIFADRLYLDTSEHPCRHDGHEVAILQEPPARPYTRVAYVESYAAFYADAETTWEDLRRQLCEQASAAGADAIIEMTVGSRAYSRLVEVVAVEVSTGGNTKKLTGVAIRFDDPAPEDAAQPR